jgi:hypothetical protein
MKTKSEQLEWLKSKVESDKKELEKEKNEFINQIKKYKKEEILPEKPKKLTLWQRIKKVLMG